MKFINSKKLTKPPSPNYPRNMAPPSYFDSSILYTLFYSHWYHALKLPPILSLFLHLALIYLSWSLHLATSSSSTLTSLIYWYFRSAIFCLLSLFKPYCSYSSAFSWVIILMSFFSYLSRCYISRANFYLLDREI